MYCLFLVIEKLKIKQLFGVVKKVKNITFIKIYISLPNYRASINYQLNIFMLLSLLLNFSVS